MLYTVVVSQAALASLLERFPRDVSYGTHAQDCVVRVVQAYIMSMVGSVDVVVQDQSIDDPLQDGESLVGRGIQG